MYKIALLTEKKWLKAQRNQLKALVHNATSATRVVNGPTSLGPNPKTNLKPKSCPKKNES